MRALFVMIVIFTVSIGAAVAQDTCDLQTAEAITLLEQAQTTADDGDIEEATELLAEARDLIGHLVSVCTPIPELTESVRLEERSADKSLTFLYPDGWVADEDEPAEIIIANSRPVLAQNIFASSGPQPLSDGDWAMYIALMTAEDIATDFDEGETPSADELLTSTLENNPEDLIAAGDVEKLSVADHRAALAQLTFNDLDVVLMIVELDSQGVDADEFIYALVAVGGASGTADRLKNLIIDVGQTFDFDIE